MLSRKKPNHFLANLTANSAIYFKNYLFFSKRLNIEKELNYNKNK